MRILIWHGWLLEGSGSNVAAARTAEAFRAAGHDVALLCQDRHPERHPWIDAFGTVGGDGPDTLVPNAVPSGEVSPAPGRAVLLRPRIGPTLPVFVVDRYEGFDDVRSFVELDDDELQAYLDANVEAVRAAVAWHRSEVAFAGHAIPGAVIARRALGSGRYVAKIHGSDLEYAIRPQERLRRLAREGLEAARAVVGPSAESLDRCAELVPEMRHLARVVPPGVDVRRFHPRPRAIALRDVADALDADPATAHGRPSSLDASVADALARRDGQALTALAAAYDQEAPDPDASARLRALASGERAIVGYLGKLIPQKGVELLLSANRSIDATSLVVGFGSHREWLEALATALARRDQAALAWLRDVAGMPVDPTSNAPDTVPTTPADVTPAASEDAMPSAIGDAAPSTADVVFTGRLDHRYAPGVLAAMDVQVVPSVLPEAFGMVAAEGAAAGTLPLVARHSGLAEVAAALEGEVGRPGLFSFEPGAGAVASLAAGIRRLLSLPRDERDALRLAVSGFVADEWTWERTAERLLAAAGTG